jgi:hypothetical protein
MLIASTGFLSTTKTSKIQKNLNIFTYLFKFQTTKLKCFFCEINKCAKNKQKTLILKNSTVFVHKGDDTVGFPVYAIEMDQKLFA